MDARHVENRLEWQNWDPKAIECTALNIYGCCKINNVANTTWKLKIIIKSRPHLHHEAWQEKQSFDYF